ncbi:MAG: recombination mediator RecR [Micavibrio sp.]|nr:recombination mediator RecR [Micavibrio sp.]
MKDGPLQHLIQKFTGLPGLGNRSARRIVLHLLSQRERTMVPLAQLILKVAEEIKDCNICGNLDMHDPCAICQDTRRSRKEICVVSQVSDLWAIERTSAYKGQYHVLGGVLSALDGVGPDQLNLNSLMARARDGAVEEVIIALSATVDGQSTAHYVSDMLEGCGVSVSHLAHGVPVGGELDYLDDGTITTALRSRK